MIIPLYHAHMPDLKGMNTPITQSTFAKKILPHSNTLANRHETDPFPLYPLS